MSRNILVGATLFAAAIFIGPSALLAGKPSVLIIDGRNNHDWRTTTEALRATLEATGTFEVAVSTAPEELLPSAPREPKGGDPGFAEAKKRYDALAKLLRPKADEAWARWAPDFSKYSAVVLNYNGPQWPEPMKSAFIQFVRGGGGVFLVHASNNAFPDWLDFNEMIGLGWRKAGFGRALIFDPATSRPMDGPDLASGHGAKHPFVVANRQPEHPVLRGMPAEWMHGRDELYHHMRGPAKDVKILASAFSDLKEGGSGLHEPVLWETAFGKGRVLTCSLGHFWRGDVLFDSLYCTGFQTLLARGVEYVATGQVTLDVPKDIPTKERQSLVAPHLVAWTVAGKPVAMSAATAADWKTKKAEKEAAPLTPEEERSTLVLPEGYVADLVAAEPMVEEPVLAVWDGNGAMYVAEMRSYMQDEAGTGTKTMRNGRIKRLTSSKGDGIMDRATIFADGLNLPRMILPLDDGIAVVETDNTSVWKFRDTKGDGVADEKTLLFKGKEGDPNHSVEHQDSGLDWNIDNWINVSYARERYRFTDGTWRAEPLPSIWSQWGLAHDDEGRLYYSENSTPFLGVQLARRYWSLIARRGASMPRGSEPINLGAQWDPDFLWAKNLCPRDDRGANAPGRKQFTSLCGQTIFRGTALEPDARGDYFFCDPTIHVIRRSKVENRNGRIFLTSRYGPEEFFISPDILCRPVNTAVGPDGCLTVVDMYRGIIQDSPWLDPKAREFIKKSGLAAQNGRGRIWRIRQVDRTPTTAPRMNEETTAELLRHLENPNGWWRDTAQKLILLRHDRETVAPLLADLARWNENPMVRLHALWTLEGMSKAEPALLQTAWRDADPRVRAAAVHITEPLFERNDAAMFEAIAPVANAERNPEVARQIILSVGWSTDPRAFTIIDGLAERFLTHEGVFLAAATALWKQNTPLIARIQSGAAFASIKDPGQKAEAAARWTQGLAQWQRELKLPKEMPKEQRDLITKGEETFYQICVSCHGSDGKGTPIPGTDQTIAAPLAGSVRVKGSPAGLVPVFVNGLLGPIAGKTYQGQMMVPAVSLGITRDDRLAEVISFIRFAWGNDASAVTKDEVVKLRQKHANRPGPWSDDELKAQAASAP